MGRSAGFSPIGIVFLGLLFWSTTALADNPILVSGGASATVAAGIVTVTNDGKSIVTVPAEEIVSSASANAIHTAGGNYTISIDGQVYASDGFDAVVAEGTGNTINNSAGALIDTANPFPAGGDGIVAVGSNATVTNDGSISANGSGIRVGDQATVVNNADITALEHGVTIGNNSSFQNNSTEELFSSIAATNGNGIAAGSGNRIENHAGSVDSLAAAGISAGDNNTIINTQLGFISGNTAAILIGNSNQITNDNTSILFGTNSGIQAGDHNQIQNNTGIISGFSGIIAGAGNTIFNLSDPDLGDGTIIGEIAGILLQVDPTAVDPATIDEATLRNLLTTAAAANLAGNSVTNDGFIQGVTVGIAAAAENTITNRATGWIDGFDAGMLVVDRNRIDNSGLISAENGAAISAGAANSIVNSGSITSNLGAGIQVLDRNHITNVGAINSASRDGITTGADNEIINSGDIISELGNGITVSDSNGFTLLPGSGQYDPATVNTITNNAPGTISGVVGIAMNGPGIITLNGGTVARTDIVQPAILTDADGGFYDQFITLATGAEIIGDFREGNGCLDCGDWDVLTLTGAGSGNYENDISFIEQIRKTGTGSWRLGDSSENSTVEVDIEQGTLQLDGYVNAATVNIRESGILGGNGEIWNNPLIGSLVTVSNGGTVAPGPAGGGIAELVIQNGTFYNYACSGDPATCSSGDLRIELQNTVSGAVNDTLRINGTTTAIFGDTGVDGGTVTPVPRSLVPDGRYTFLYSDSLVINVAPTLVAPSPLFQYSLGWDGNTMWMDVAQVSSLAAIGADRNDQVIYDVISALADSGNEDALNTLGAILQTGTPLDLLGMLSPEQYPSLLDISMAGFDLYRSGVLGRMGNLHLTRGPQETGYAGNSNTLVDGDPALARLPVFLPNRDGWNGWVRGLGLTATQDGDAGKLGFDLESYGVALGFDYQLSEQFVVGLGGGYTRNQVDFDGFGQETDVDGYHLALYSSWSSDAFYLDGAVLFARNDYDTERMTPVVRATSNTDGTEWGVYLGGGFNVVNNAAWYLIPTVSAQWARVDIDGFTEEGAGPLNLTVNDLDADSLVTTLGIRLGANLKIGYAKVEPELRLSWAHEFGDTDRSVQASFAMGGPTFTIEGVEPKEDSALVGAGVKIGLFRDFIAFVDYDGEFRSDFDAHMLSGGIRYNFEL